MAKKEQTSAIPLILGAVVLGVIAAVMASLFLNAKERELKDYMDKRKQLIRRSSSLREI